MFCDDLVKQQHDDILNNVKQKTHLIFVNCGHCNLRTLMPDHACVRNCTLGQVHCNCMYPKGKIPCPNNVCGAIYDEIIKHHGSTPPAPYWRNTDVQKWCTDPWAIAKCFISSPGYLDRSTASDMDTSALLQLLLNNTDFHKHLQSAITGRDAFSQVRMYRNEIMHNHSMELADTDVIRYLDAMTEILQDEKELKHRIESKVAVEKLAELKQEDFIITTKSQDVVIQDVMLAIMLKEEELKVTIQDANDEIDTKRAQINSEAEEKIKELDERLKMMRDISKEMDDRRVQVRNGEVITVTSDGTDTERGAQTAVDNRSVNATTITVGGAVRAPIINFNGPIGSVNMYNANQ